MTRTTRANSILGAIIVVLLLLAIGYYASGTSNETAQTPALPTQGSDPTSTGSTNR